jgi:hypothetical protein
MLMSWRLIGIAANTPSAAITTNQRNMRDRVGPHAREHEQGRDGGHVAAAGHVAGGGRHGAHGVVLEHPELALW